MQRGNIHATLPVASGEVFEELVAFPADRVRIERIVSRACASPPGFWYDQDWDEWVLVLRGGAVLEFAGPHAVEHLREGEWLFIPAHRRHRVNSTEPETIWLAVHGGGDATTSQ